MTVDETLQLARSHGVEVRLNAVGDGLSLEVEADPPQALMNVLRRIKWDIVAALRKHEVDRRFHAARRLPPLRRGRAGRRRLRPPVLRRR